MSEKIYFLLLILCGTLSQGIIATSSDDDIRESSDLLAREKRVVNVDAEPLNNTPIEELKYMVMIKEMDRANCVGAILSHYTVITAELCVKLEKRNYRIVSGTAFANHGHGSNHSVSSKLTNFGNPPHEQHDGIALINVEPHFVLDSKTGTINLYTGPLPTGTTVTVSGWGSCNPVLPTLRLQRRLRQINVPIMDHRQCQHTYRLLFPITYKHICTYHDRQYCARTDVGAPLVVHNMLAGIHVVKPEIRNSINPEVFIDIQLPTYKAWITRNIRYI